MEQDINDAPTIIELKSETRTAAKLHECGICRKFIQPGQKYLLYVSVIDGKFSVDKFHPSTNCVFIDEVTNNKLENVTTHHPRRFPSAWVGQSDMLLFNHTHVCAYVDGQIVDWSIQHSKYIVDAWTIEKVTK